MTEPPSPGASPIAVIGAGVAGIACAERLREQGLTPILFEKSRGLGGRLATRRVPDGPSFDHGAQYVTARNPAFRARIDAAVEIGTARRWLPETGSGGVQGADAWYVGTPTMNAMIKPGADGIETRLSTEITTIVRQGSGWRLQTASASLSEPMGAVVVTAPAPQARRLVAAEPRMAESLASVEMAPCWSLMLQLDGPADPGFDILRSPNDDLAWVSRNSSKPGRDPSCQAWVAHAGVEWTLRHLEDDRDTVARTMLDAVLPLLGRSRQHVQHAEAHRWRYARTLRPLGAACLGSADGTLLVAGDWCLGARVECAFESGRAAADAVLAGSGRALDLMASRTKP